VIGVLVLDAVEKAIPGAASCGLPPVECDTSASAATAAGAGAAIPTNCISKSLLNSDSPCGFQKFVVDATDSTMSEDNWVTITVQPDGVLSLSARSKTTNFAYRSITIDSYGRNVGMDKYALRKPPNMATARSFGVEIPISTINEA
jgi:hypothetical protein